MCFLFQQREVFVKRGLGTTSLHANVTRHTNTIMYLHPSPALLSAGLQGSALVHAEIYPARNCPLSCQADLFDNSSRHVTCCLSVEWQQGRAQQLEGVCAISHDLLMPF